MHIQLYPYILFNIFIVVSYPVQNYNCELLTKRNPISILTTQKNIITVNLRSNIKFFSHSFLPTKTYTYKPF